MNMGGREVWWLRNGSGRLVVAGVVLSAGGGVMYFRFENLRIDGLEGLVQLLVSCFEISL